MRYILSLLLLVTSSVVFAAEFKGDRGPETMNLTDQFEITRSTRPSVIFAHHWHQDKLSLDCQACHINPTGKPPLKNQVNGNELMLRNIRGASNAAHNNFCWPCHAKFPAAQESVGRRCAACHK